MLKCCGVKTEKVAESIDSLRKAFGESISKNDCLVVAQDESAMNLGNVGNLKYYPYLSLGVPAPPLNIQRECIHFVIRPDINLEQYIKNHLNIDHKFYLLNANFWNAWRKSRSEESTFVVDGLNKVINMDLPIEEGYSMKLQSHLIYNDNFVIVPERVYQLFRQWQGYISSPTIRKVIKYTEDKPSLYNPNEVRAKENEIEFKKKYGEYFYELELSPYFFLCFKVREEGEFPGIHKPSLWNLFKSTAKTAESKEIYVSR